MSFTEGKGVHNNLSQERYKRKITVTAKFISLLIIPKFY